MAARDSRWGRRAQGVPVALTASADLQAEGQLTGPERRALSRAAPPASRALLPVRRQGDGRKRPPLTSETCRPSGPDGEGQARGPARWARGEPLHSSVPICVTRVCWFAMPAPTPSTFNLPTFVVAAVGAASGLAAVAWNVVPYVSAGAKISVRIEYIFVGTKASMEPAFEVKANNKRRGSIEIRQWGIATYGPTSGRHPSIAYLKADTDDSDEAPKTVPGKHGAAWTVYARSTLAFAWNRNNKIMVKGIVELGNGKRKASKPLRLPSGALHEVPRIEA